MSTLELCCKTYAASRNKARFCKRFLIMPQRAKAASRKEFSTLERRPPGWPYIIFVSRKVFPGTIFPGDETGSRCATAGSGAAMPALPPQR
jgi:hypothetical protein